MTFDSRITQTIVTDAAAGSPTLAATLKFMKTDPGVIVNIHQGPLGGDNPGLVSDRGTNENGQHVIDVTLDFGNAKTLANVPEIQKGGGVTYADVVGHELFSHALANSVGYVCPDANGCAKNRENIIRKELGHPPRKF